MKMHVFLALSIVIRLFCFLVIVSCAPTSIIRTLHNTDKLNPDDFKKNDYPMKVHMKDGKLYLLSSFIVTKTNDTLIGKGDLYNPDRKIIKKSDSQFHFPKIEANDFRIPFSSIALVEANSIKGLTGKMLSMGLIGAPTSLISLYCLINPKACFGSCPTFYAWNGTSMKLMAEGFSSSILPSFEKKDVDMLYWTKTNGRDFILKLSNEALETHIIRNADLMVFPKNANERIFAAGDEKFYKTKNILTPDICNGPEGDCRDLLLQMDARERFSVSDSLNLVTKECVEIEFKEPPANRLGIVIGARQTLLTTFLFYQGLAYAGDASGYLMAKVESGDQNLKHKVEKIWDLLGGIEVFVKSSSGKWISTGSVREMGPIATDVHLLQLPEIKNGPLRIMLKMTKGLWRIDYVGLAEIDKEVRPIVINPSFVITNDTINNLVLNKLCNSSDPLITLPGDEHFLHYQLPDNENEYEFFLKSGGYYLEWQRETWIAEQNLKKAYFMFQMPRLYLKTAAKKFKMVEPEMEESFWRSRYVKN